ncbi:hypothetical protein Dsin_020787 [Dipteronia sinensis]|uniref:RNase H type-1 domain-containing protein n=1 Tax=Dipteronia sinensis TaxID=43782 RepID=A0AAE0E4A8_9ROSI|nr:hypothetical protein Dsin_020787 [Dipteronia sinensis]
MANLACRGVRRNCKCPIYGSFDETTLHALYSCRKLKALRGGWLPNNSFILNSHIPDLSDVVDWAQIFLFECQLCNERKAVSLSCGRVINIKWKPLDPEVYKINCDATVDGVGVGCFIGIGNIIRDFSSFVIASCSHKIVASFSPHLAETVAIFKGLQFAKDC